MDGVWSDTSLRIGAPDTVLEGGFRFDVKGFQRFAALAGAPCKG